MRAVILLFAALGAILFVSCGGGGEEGGAPSPVATPTGEVAAGDLTPSGLIAQLPGLLLTAEDVPSGFALSQSVAAPNEAVAAGDPLPEQRLRELEEAGRVNGHQVIFESLQGLLSVVLAVHETTEGAQQSLDMGVRFGPDIEASSIDAPDVGLPAAAWEIEGQTGRALKGYLMLARKGRINISVVYADAGGVGRDDAEGLLSAQIARLGDME